MRVRDCEAFGGEGYYCGAALRQVTGAGCRGRANRLDFKRMACDISQLKPQDEAILCYLNNGKE